MVTNDTKMFFKMAQWGINVVASASFLIAGFTINQAVALWEDMACVKRQIAVLDERINALPAEAPPKWFLNRVDKMEANLEQMNTKLTEIMVRIGNGDKR